MTLDDGRAELAGDNGHSAGEDGAFGKRCRRFCNWVCVLDGYCLTGLRKERARTR